MRAKVLAMVLVALAASAAAAMAQVLTPDPGTNPFGANRPNGRGNQIVVSPAALPPAADAPQRGGDDYELRQITPDGSPDMAYTIFRAVPSEQDLTRKAAAIGRKLAEAKSESDRQKIAQELSKALGEQFDTRQKRHQEELRKLEEQVKKLKELVEKRQENRNEIIARRMEQIVRESQGLGW